MNPQAVFLLCAQDKKQLLNFNNSSVPKSSFSLLVERKLCKKACLSKLVKPGKVACGKMNTSGRNK